MGGAFITIVSILSVSPLGTFQGIFSVHKDGHRETLTHRMNFSKEKSLKQKLYLFKLIVSYFIC